MPTDDPAVDSANPPVQELEPATPPPPPPPPDEEQGGGSVAAEGAPGFVFPDGYASRGYTRDNLSKLEQRYFDDLEESKNPTKAQVVLDKFDLCHQAGLDSYDDTTAFIEDRATIEEMLKEKEELAEVRRRECERQSRLEARKEEAMELPRECAFCASFHAAFCFEFVRHAAMPTCGHQDCTGLLTIRVLMRISRTVVFPI